MEKDDILAFQALAKYGSFTKASEALYIAQPTLSKKIAILENELGLTLVERTKRYARLTYAGIVFLEESKALLAQEEKMLKAVREAAKTGARSLRIGIMGTGLAGKSLPFIRAFREKHPEVSLHFDLLDFRQIQEALSAKRLDCAMTDDLGLSFPESLKTEEIGESWHTLVFPSNHPFVMKKRKTFRSLETEPFLVLQGNSSARGLALVKGICAKWGFTPKIEKVCSTAEEILFQVRAGQGIAILPSFDCPSEDVPGLSYISLKEETKPFPTVLAWNEGNTNPALLLWKEELHGYLEGKVVSEK